MLFAGSCFLASQLAGQNPDTPSLAEAARLNREQKKVAAKPGTVITNDTLNPAPASASPQATVPANQTPNAAKDTSQTDTAGSHATANSELSAQDTEKLKEEIAGLKQQLKDKQGELELLQRLLNLDRDAILSKPDSSHDAAGKAKLDSEQQELTLKEEEFAKLKAKLESIAPQDRADQTSPKP